MDPAEPLVFDYVPGSGAMANILKFASQFDYKVVVKPLKGTGGGLVSRAHSPKELEAAVYKVWMKDYGVAISPLLDIRDEIRVVVFDGSARLVYRKVRLSIKGDGLNSLKELFVSAMETSSVSSCKYIAEGIGRFTVKELNTVPEAGSDIPVEWRHNLGLGATAQIVDHPAAVAIALAAAKTLGMRFCSVDVVQLEDDSLHVLEVNAGVMMDSFLTSSDENRNLAKQIYTDVLKQCLNS